MNRRQFFELTGLMGMTAAMGTPSAFAQTTTGYNGPLFLSIHCGGGWDPTSFCDPKGRATEDEPNPMNYYLQENIGRPTGSAFADASPIRWAPMAENQAFFERFWQRLLVINGVDTSTNNHMSGTRHVNSGVLEEGHPCFASMLAATHGGDLPLSFITNGGYDVTRGIVSRARLGNINALRRLSYPHQAQNGSNFLHASTFDRVRHYQMQRLERQRSVASLPRLKRSLEKFSVAHSSENELARLEDFLPELNGFNTNLGRQGAVALAGYRAGITISANLTTGGFDTHSNHDNNQGNALTNLTQGIHEVWDQVEEFGLQDQVVLFVSSDFGRTPGYNGGNGKDH